MRTPCHGHSILVPRPNTSWLCMEAALKHAAAILGNARQAEGGSPRRPRVTRVRLPIGFGKSFCFHCLPLVNDYLSGCHESSIVVVEPTAEVMRDHVEALLAKGRRAAFVNHEQRDSSTRQGVIEGKYQYVYIHFSGVSHGKSMLSVHASLKCIQDTPWQWMKPTP